MNDSFNYGKDTLTADVALKIARGQVNGIILEETKQKIEKNFQAVQSILEGDKLVYSINTGFGSLCTTKITLEESGHLQENLLKFFFIPSQYSRNLLNNNR